MLQKVNDIFVWIVIQSHGSKVGIIEMNNRCTRENVSTKYMLHALKYECNSVIQC